MSRVISKEILEVSADAISTLQVPKAALGCYISLDADIGTNDRLKVCRFWQTGDAPTATDGATLADGGYYEICTRPNLENFKVIGIEAGLTHRLMIEYYE